MDECVPRIPRSCLRRAMSPMFSSIVIISRPVYVLALQIVREGVRVLLPKSTVDDIECVLQPVPALRNETIQPISTWLFLLWLLQTHYLEVLSLQALKKCSLASILWNLRHQSKLRSAEIQDMWFKPLSRHVQRHGGGFAIGSFAGPPSLEITGFGDVLVRQRPSN